MGHRLLRSDLAHLLERVLTEWAAACGQDDLLDRIDAREIEALPNRIVLAVDRKQRRSTTSHFLHDKGSGTNEHFFVGQCNDGAAPDRGQGGGQPGRADDPGHNPVSRTERRFCEGFSATRGLDPGTRKGRLQRRIMRGIGNGREPRSQGASLLRQPYGVAIRSECFNLEAVGIAQQQVDGALTDRTGRAENRYSPYTVFGVSEVVGRLHRHASRLRPPIRVSSATTGITASSPSSLSSSPPWPGMRPLESFTPNLRFATDSARSPNCSITARPALTSTTGSAGEISSQAAVAHPAKAAQTMP